MRFPFDVAKRSSRLGIGTPCRSAALRRGSAEVPLGCLKPTGLGRTSRKTKDRLAMRAMEKVLVSNGRLPVRRPFSPIMGICDKVAKRNSLTRTCGSGKEARILTCSGGGKSPVSNEDENR